MNLKPELTIVIPAYNEEENLKIILPDLIAFVEQCNWKLIITNDGSKDNTKTIAQMLDSASKGLTVSAFKRVTLG